MPQLPPTRTLKAGSLEPGDFLHENGCALITRVERDEAPDGTEVVGIYSHSGRGPWWYRSDADVKAKRSFP